MPLHLFYVLAGNEALVLPKTAVVRDLRLLLPNGEAKVPHGGMSLLCQVRGRQESLTIRDQSFKLVGRAVLRGGVRTGGGTFSFTVEEPGSHRPVRYALQAAFRAVKRQPDMPAFRDAHAVEFVATSLVPADDPCYLLHDPGVLRQFEEQRLQKYEGEMSTDDLVQMLGGALDLGGVKFTGEGGFRLLEKS